MFCKTVIIFVTLSLIPGEAQRPKLLSRLGTRPSRNASNPDTRKVTNSNANFAELLSDTVNTLFTSVPIAITRSLNGGNGINGVSVPYNDKNFASNLGSLGESFLSEFNYGLRHEDCKLDCVQLISKYGYPVETHEVITEDGYILQMFRIPSDGEPILLQHGLLGSADDYIIAGSESGLGYLLSKQGYDVWLCNSRGNKHARRHIKLNPSQGAFWDYSWHEVGYYDLPAMIDYTLNVTGKDKVKYIGHSQGTTSFWVMGSERPEYMDKISLMVALSPVAFNSHMKSPFMRLVAPSSGLLYGLAKYFGVHELASDNSLMRLIRWMACGTGPLAELVCSNFMFLVVGFNAEQVNATNLPIIFSHVPAGSSTKGFIHYGQEIISQKFRQFDYGSAENIKRYGSSEPPDYNLRNVTAPVALIYSHADWLVSARDVAKLEKLLPNVVESHVVADKNFNHMDYLIAKDVKRILYKRLFKMLSRF